jgi:hypothetical protein
MLLNKLKTFCKQVLGSGSRPATAECVRPTLDTLEDRTVPSTVVADFPGQGLYTYTYLSESVHVWHKINGYDPSAMAVDSATGNVVATFPGFGTALWRASTNSWQMLTSADASILSISPASQQVIAEFPGYGVWEYAPKAGWAQLTPANASSLAIDVVGNVVAEFPGYGVWYDDALGHSWAQITPADASQVVFADVGFVMAEFPGYGVWDSHDGGSWVQMTGADASSLAGSGNGGMAAATFTGYGTYAYNVTSATWYLIDTRPNYGLATDGADFAGVFADDQGLVSSIFAAGSGTWQDFDFAGASLIGVSAM